MFVNAYINSAKEILDNYNGEEPFSSFLKRFFREHKKFGSRDRKQITHLGYCFFRLGKSLGTYSVEERFAIALFLCNNSQSPVLERLNKDWNKKIEDNLDEKIKLVQQHYNFKPEDIFPWQQQLSDLIEYKPFARSFFVQPDIFIRVRPGKEITVKQQLIQSGISFQLISDDCISIAPSRQLDEVIVMNKDAVIQDLNSQQVLHSFIKQLKSKNKIQTAWDCCAASGGKSILLKDQLPFVQLTVSDKRESILINLRKRFQLAGIKNYKWFVADISSEKFQNKKEYDLIICDAPCSGSGTWSRTPEQLYFFDEKKIETYSSLQKKIVINAAKSLKKDGFFIYITCSVFKKENEQIVNFIEKELSLQLIEMDYLKGYRYKADSLFTALFTLTA